MAVDPGTVYLVAGAVVVVTIGIISIFCGGKSKETGDAARVAPAAVARPRDENAPPGRRVRRRPNRNRMQMAGGDSDEEEGGAPPPSDEEGEGIFDDFGEGKIGAKKLRKLQDKAEKKRQREIELQEREERKEREKKVEHQRKKEEEREKAEEAAQAEEERIRKEEQERQEQEEYLKMKAMFSVEEEGETETVDLDSQSLLQEFINYIKEMKVVMLEDLAAHFKIRTQDCINRIQDLQADGKLTGVVDDRGKFIYITMDELDSVAKYIRQLGRVSISELAESSNRLINLNPDNADVHKKLIVGDHPELVEVET